MTEGVFNVLGERPLDSPDGGPCRNAQSLLHTLETSDGRSAVSGHQNASGLSNQTINRRILLIEVQ